MGIREGIRHHDQATIRLAGLRANDGFELGPVVNRCCDRLHGEGDSGGFEGVQPIFEICRRCRVEQEGYPGGARRNLLKQLQPLASHRGLYSDETGNVPSRLRKARDKAAADRIGNERENNGDGACLLQQHRGDRRALRHNEVGLQRDELLRKSLHRLDVAGCRPAGIDPDIAALCPAELLKSLAQRRDTGLPYRIVRGEWHEHADAPHPLGLLRARHKRPRCRAAKERDELAPSQLIERHPTLPSRERLTAGYPNLAEGRQGASGDFVGEALSHAPPLLPMVLPRNDEAAYLLGKNYSITSSARASTVAGGSRPSAWAVFRLITNSYLVGACTGRSAGFSPLRMRST